MKHPTIGSADGHQRTFLSKRFTKQTLYFIHVIDDCRSRKVVSKWCNRRNSEKALLVLKEWVELHGKPMKVMHMMVVKNLHLINSKIILDFME
jgi:hypothetical protein